MATQTLKQLQPVISIFLVVIIGVTFVVANANTISPSINSQPIFNESFNFASARIIANSSINESKTFTVALNPTVTDNVSLISFTLSNATGSLATVTTDYVINLSTGVFTLKNTSTWSNVKTNISLANYNYQANAYVNDAGSRTMLSFIDFFSALGILLVVVGYIYRAEIWEFLER